MAQERGQRALRYMHACTHVPVTDPLYQCSGGLTISVRAHVTLSARSRSIRAGHGVSLRGRLRGGYVAP